MIKLLDLLLEARQAGPLYHFTGVRGLELIIDTNTFRASPGYVSGDPSDRVSFTRNKNYYWNIIRIGVDGDKLSTKYKITPYSYQQGAKGVLDQSEEVVEKDISNAKSYITDVTYILDEHKNYEHKVPISYLQQLWPSIKFSYKGKEFSPEEAAKQFKFPTKKPKGGETGLYDTKISYDEMSSLKGKLMFVYYHLTYGSNKLINKDYANELNALLSKYGINKNSQKTGIERSNSEDLLNDMIAFGKKHNVNTTKDFYGDIMVGDLEMYRDEEENW
jgi:hypothetical protein